MAQDSAAQDPVTQDSWRDRSAVSWRGRKAVLASRGEVDGPRVDECDAALSNHRVRVALIEWGCSEGQADTLIDSATQTPEASRR